MLHALHTSITEFNRQFPWFFPIFAFVSAILGILYEYHRED